ncbi:TcaA second domain-containing protein [Priestia endophytica]|uniref:TcaA second domain-containing protein n=1 Tax=Priestia endophytica TaxID=135735 RepID=UPI002281F5B2|nr:hypothetical protein [Priestia endophytica]MCY8232089.1 hypothetical protein [Priestia endophytica]
MKKWILTSAAIVLLLIVGASIVVQQNTQSPEEAVKEFEKAVSTKDTDLLSELIVPNNEKAQVNKTSLQAFANYLQSNSSSLEAIEDSLNEQLKEKNFTETNSQVSLVEDGKELLFFPKYKFEVKTMELAITGEQEGEKVTLSSNGFKKGLPKEKDSLYGPFLPGEYTFKLSVKTDLATFIGDRKKELWGTGKTSLLIDSEKMAQSDEKVKKDLVSAVELFNKDFSRYETSEFQLSAFSNATQELMSGESNYGEGFEEVKDALDEIQSQYEGGIVDLDSLDISYFDGKWKANASAAVSYMNKVKVSGGKEFEDLSYGALRDYQLVYSSEKKQWLIDGMDEYDYDDDEVENWEYTQETNPNNPVFKWTRDGKKDEGSYY